ncbi:TRAP transporter small permease [Anaerotruncus rubiinfantis]|jgi:TRAP-type C4-dicarboxylate transport system permease small subunit|uniref:TRAP transporter small permease n=1 Tax=Anaerotruncus rubiinfantis TaxID=1720200 RepID=UPI00189A9880|nr:TRAP transporter small permease [Anaerotruncus rubiinfantis]
MKTFFSGLRKVETALAVISMVAFTAVAFLQVTFRVFLHNPLGWSEELCKFLFIWCTFIGAILVSADNGHFCVDFFVTKCSPVVQKILKYLSFALVALFSVILIYFGVKLMMSNTNRISPALGIQMSYIYTIFPINGVLVILHLIESIWKDAKARKEA